MQHIVTPCRQPPVGVVKQREPMSAGSCFSTPENAVPIADGWPPLLVAAAKHCVPLQAAAFWHLEPTPVGGQLPTVSLLRLSDSCCRTPHYDTTSLCCRLQPAPKRDHPPCECCPAPANCGQGHWLAVCHFLIMTSPRSDPSSAYALASGSRCQQGHRLSEGFELKQQPWSAPAATAEPHLL